MAEEEANTTVTLEGSALRIQSVFRAWKAIRRWKARVRLHVRRSYVANEIVETETRYVENLSILLKVFYYPLCKSTIVPTDRLEQMFGNISVIYDIHADMLEELKERLENWGYEQTFGDVLNKYWKRMKIYSEYVNKYDASVEAIKSEVKNNKPFAKFMKHAATDERLKKRDVFDFAIQPVQRIPRYALLINELQKYTPDTSRDFELLKKATSSVKLILRYFNESKRMLQRREDSVTKIKAIKRSVSGVQPFLAEGRAFVMEGPMTLHRKKKVDSVYCFLFQETLLIAQSLSASKKKNLKKRMAGYKFSAIKMVKLKKYTMVKQEKKRSILLKHQAHRSWNMEIETETSVELNKWYDALSTTLKIEETMDYLHTSVDQL